MVPPPRALAHHAGLSSHVNSERPSLISQHGHPPCTVILLHGTLFVFLIDLFILCNSFY